MRHKKFLRQLEKQKNEERNEQMEQVMTQQQKQQQLKDQAARQREKIKNLKQTEVAQENDMVHDYQ